MPLTSFEDDDIPQSENNFRRERGREQVGESFREEVLQGNSDGLYFFVNLGFHHFKRSFDDQQIFIDTVTVVQLLRSEIFEIWRDHNSRQPGQNSDRFLRIIDRAR